MPASAPTRRPPSRPWRENAGGGCRAAHRLREVGAIYSSPPGLLRDAGAGPTLVVSPLLALMRDQVAAADHIGRPAGDRHSTNLDEWTEIEVSLAAGATSGRPVGQNVAPVVD